MRQLVRQHDCELCIFRSDVDPESREGTHQVRRMGQAAAHIQQNKSGNIPGSAVPGLAYLVILFLTSKFDIQID